MYHYPKGHESVGELKGLELGAKVCTGLKRTERAATKFVPDPSYRKRNGKNSSKEQSNGKLAFVGLDSKGALTGQEVGRAEWFFEIDASAMDPDTSPMFALKVRFCYRSRRN